MSSNTEVVAESRTVIAETETGEDESPNANETEEEEIEGMVDEGPRVQMMGVRVMGGPYGTGRLVSLRPSNATITVLPYEAVPHDLNEPPVAHFEEGPQDAEDNSDSNAAISLDTATVPGGPTLREILNAFEVQENR